MTPSDSTFPLKQMQEGKMTPFSIEKEGGKEDRKRKWSRSCGKGQAVTVKEVATCLCGACLTPQIPVHPAQSSAICRAP